MTSAYPNHRRQSSLPLFFAGAAFILTAWLVADRMGFLSGGPRGEPRAITPRGDLADYEKDVIQIFEENAPSVVHITTENLVRTYFGVRKFVEGTGSGFVWDESGTVITNYHVIKGHERDAVKVAVDGQVLSAVLVNASPSHDIAVLRILGAPRDLRPVQLGTSSDLRVGQSVVAIGNPFGLDQTLSTGVVSALNRTITTENKETLYDVIQIDAAINPGNSGGPLLDSAGRLIGMNTAIYSPSGASAGIGFAVPVDSINPIVADLIAGRPVQPLLGIEGTPYSFSSSRIHGYRGGVVVREVHQDMGAAAAGLVPFVYDDRGSLRSSGDLIVEVDTRPVRSPQQITEILRSHRRGESVSIKVIRGLPDRAELVELTVELR